MPDDCLISLLQVKDTRVNRVYQAGTDPYREPIENDHTFSDNFPDVPELIENPKAAKIAPDPDESAFKEFDNDLTPFEASIMDEESAWISDHDIFGDSEGFGGAQREGRGTSQDPITSHKRTFGDTHYSTKLFVTTSSPEKDSIWSARAALPPIFPPEKPKEISDDYQHAPKRQRLETADVEETSPVTVPFGQQERGSHKVEEVHQLDPGDGIDPEIYAEYKDIIEFI